MLGVGRKAIYKMNKCYPFERRGTIFDLVLGSNPNAGQLEIFWHKLVCVCSIITSYIMHQKMSPINPETQEMN